MAERSTTMMAVLLIVGLVIGGGVGYFAAPKGAGEGDVVEVEVPVEVEVHPLAGKTLQIGTTVSSTSGLETQVPYIEEILEPNVAEFMDSLGLGITFDFLIEDNQGTAAIALEKTQTYKAMGVNLVIGHGWSSQCQAALSYVNENDMILLSSSSTSPILAITDDMLFRTCPNDFVQSPAIARMWSTWGVKGVLTMHRADAWGDGLWNILEVEWPKVGITDLGRIRYAGEVTEFSSYLDNANEIITDAIEEYGGAQYVGMQFFSFAELRTIQTQAADYPNLIDIIWMGTESGGRSQLMLDEAGDWATRTRHFSSFMGVDEGSFMFNEFDELYYELTSYRTGFYTATDYDACWLMVKSILETGSIEAHDVAEVLIPMSRQFHGLTGWLALDENGDRMPQIFDIWGFYEDPDTGEYLFRKWGSYDGRIIEVTWDDDAIETYGGITRPALAG
jgi:branched-chain amino acid transport system substrate-binding protein